MADGRALHDAPPGAAGRAPRAPAHERRPGDRAGAELLALRGIGLESAWLYVMECFAWRRFRNRRQVGGLAGLVAAHYQSGDLQREQGISKAGNRYIRALAINLAWAWIRYQPTSALARWYTARFARGPSRVRKIGIVAVARKLLSALWRYLEFGIVPEGAVLRG